MSESLHLTKEQKARARELADCIKEYLECDPLAPSYPIFRAGVVVMGAELERMGFNVEWSVAVDPVTQLRSAYVALHLKHPATVIPFRGHNEKKPPE